MKMDNIESLMRFVVADIVTPASHDIEHDRFPSRVAAPPRTHTPSNRQPTPRSSSSPSQRHGSSVSPLSLSSPAPAGPPLLRREPPSPSFRTVPQLEVSHDSLSVESSRGSTPLENIREGVVVFEWGVGDSRLHSGVSVQARDILNEQEVFALVEAVRTHRP